MWLDLKDIIEMPGAEVRFDCDLLPDDLDSPSVKRHLKAPHAEGRVKNTAGVLTLSGEIHADMLCVCDRCGREFRKSGVTEVEAPLAADMDDEDDAEIFPVRDNGIDLDEVLGTCFLLQMDMKCLCREDCKGLCPVCGKDLNEGPCDCAKPVDPRLAVLGQLLDRES